VALNMFSKYISQFSKSVENEQTHLSFNKGKYNVPDEKFDEFYKKYFETLLKGDEDLYLIEKVYNSQFAFFLDLDAKNINLTDDDIVYIIDLAKKVISKMFVEDENKTIYDYVITKRLSNYHINFYNLIVNNDLGKKVTTKIIESPFENEDIKLKNTHERLRECIDMSVYRTGLRLLGSKKSDRLTKKEDSLQTYYKIYDN
jgi:hypothetical protein